MCHAKKRFRLYQYAVKWHANVSSDMFWLQYGYMCISSKELMELMRCST